MDQCDLINATSKSHRGGLRAVAALEFIKGVLVMAASLGLVEIIRKDIDLEDAAQNLLYFLHIDPDRRLSQAFVNMAGRVMDANIATVLAIATVYSTLRFIEAYGLWRARVWAEWLAIVSGAIYLPFELYNLIRRPTPGHWIILLINVAVVIYIAWVRWDEIHARGVAPSGLLEHGD